MSLPAQPHARRWRWVAFTMVLIAGLGTALLLRGRDGRGDPTTSPERSGPSVAVLPFVNAGGNPDDQYFADGVTDEVIAGLGKVPGLQVAARGSAFSFKGPKVEPREVARRLGVDAVLEGTVRRSGNRVWVTATLVNAADGRQLWSSSLEKDGSDPFAVQDEVIRGVAAGLSLQLDGPALAASQAGRTGDPEAHDLYLRGLRSSNSGNEVELRRALEDYQLALARDPGFALPQVGIARVNVFLADGAGPPREAYSKAKSAAQAALARDERLADAHALLAYASFSLDWSDAATPEREFARAVELDPNSVNVRFLRAAHRCFTGRTDRGLEDLDLAERLDPLSPRLPALREVCNYFAGRYPAVIAAHRRTTALDPGFLYLQSWAGAAYRELRDPEASLREYKAAADTLGDVPQYGLALTYLRLGRVDEARAIARALDERATTRYVPFVTRAIVRGALGDLEQGVALLGQAVDQQEGLFLGLSALPEVDPLRGAPRTRPLFERAEAIRRAR